MSAILLVSPIHVSAKDGDDLLLELLECRGPADPDWRPLAAQLSVQGVPYEDEVTEICFEPVRWEFNGLHITSICGRGLPRTPLKTDYFTISVTNSVSQTMEWIEKNVGPTGSEVTSFRRGATVTCWPKG